MSESSDPLREELLNTIIQDSKDRLADPRKFTLEALEDLFAFESHESGGRRNFTVKLQSFFWWADDAIQCFEKVIQSPPEDLGAQIQKIVGSIYVQREKEEVILKKPEEFEHWFSHLTTQFRAEFNRYVQDKSQEI